MFRYIGKHVMINQWISTPFQCDFYITHIPVFNSAVAVSVESCSPTSILHNTSLVWFGKFSFTADSTIHGRGHSEPEGIIYERILILEWIRIINRGPKCSK